MYLLVDFVSVVDHVSIKIKLQFKLMKITITDVPKKNETFIFNIIFPDITIIFRAVPD